MSEEHEEHYRNIFICGLCRKHIESDKVRGHCRLTGNYRGPAHQKRNGNVTQKQNKFISLTFHNFSNYDCHLLFNKLVGKNNDKL